MDQLTEILYGLASLFTAPDSSVYWAYLVSTILLASGIYVVTNRAGLSLKGMVSFCFPGHIYLGAGFRRDLVMMLANTLLYSFFIAPYLLTSALISGYVEQGLRVVQAPSVIPFGGHGASILLSVAALVAADLGFFISHWLQHKIGFLWEFHKVHHSATELNPFTIFRRHPLDFAIEGNITGVLLGITFGVFGYFSGGELDMYTFLGVNIFLFLFLMIGAHLQHSHVWLSYGRYLSQLFISPAMHQIHHSKDPRHRDRNMGNIFSFWDRLTGTQWIPAKREYLDLGLAGDEERQFQSITRLYLLPFLNVWRRLLSVLSVDILKRAPGGRK